MHDRPSTGSDSGIERLVRGEQFLIERFIAVAFRQRNRGPSKWGFSPTSSSAKAEGYECPLPLPKGNGNESEYHRRLTIFDSIFERAFSLNSCVYINCLSQVVPCPTVPRMFFRIWDNWTQELFNIFETEASCQQPAIETIPLNFHSQLFTSLVPPYPALVPLPGGTGKRLITRAL
jgi:hypothetical protein